MTTLRNTELELIAFRLRISVALSVIVVVFGLLVLRLAWLQIIHHHDYLTQSEDNRTSVIPLTPSRGLILDRNGVVLARNYSAYTLEITPSKVKNIEAVIDDLSTFITITARDRSRFKKLSKDSPKLSSFPIRTRLDDDEVAKFTAQRYRFKGVEVQARLFRQYPMGEAASHLLGYIGRISEKDALRIEADEDIASNYLGTEYIGKDGLEKRYESVLHGKTGFETVEVSSHGSPIRTLSQTTSLPGNNLILSIDIELQKSIESWYGDNRGALVALDPATGEVLAMVSKPNYDPNLFVEGIDIDNWKALNESLDKPLLNRPLAGLYPPGSTYKPFMALAALTLGKRTPEQSIADPGYFMLGTHRFRDDKAGGHGTVNMYRSIVDSCNTYYYILANDLGVDSIHDFMKPLGFGQITGIDLDGERAGVLPSTEWKRKAYKNISHQKWYAGETISIGIGQGYNSFTMLQLAQATATLANQGIQQSPHLVVATEDSQTNIRTPIVLKPKVDFKFKPEHVEVIKRALIGVNIEGTSSGAFRNTPYQAAGKTGTAQAIGIKKDARYNASKIAERYRDHALYMAFAPADKPTIALAMIVENAGFGAQSAAPIARKIFDYWLIGKREMPISTTNNATNNTVNNTVNSTTNNTINNITTVRKINNNSTIISDKTQSVPTGIKP
ncbi:MAG: penicillin-binding protein 2 [Pseudomonadota bacterium]|jgi:penicillin-binding protein 2